MLWDSITYKILKSPIPRRPRNSLSLMAISISTGFSSQGSKVIFWDWTFEEQLSSTGCWASTEDSQSLEHLQPNRQVPRSCKLLKWSKTRHRLSTLVMRKIHSYGTLSWLHLWATKNHMKASIQRTRAPRGRHNFKLEISTTLLWPRTKNGSV